MDNSEIADKLAQGKEEEKQAEGQEVVHKFVIFRIEKKGYALPAEEVKEISFDNQIYFVPFLPPYIRGYANRHGAPYTVMDIRMLFDNTELESATMLILNIPNDQLALLITDVEEIIKVPESEVHSISSNDEISAYFIESITLNKEEIFVLNTGTLLERLESDVERI